MKRNFKLYGRPISVSLTMFRTTVAVALMLFEMLTGLSMAWTRMAGELQMNNVFQVILFTFLFNRYDDKSPGHTERLPRRAVVQAVRIRILLYTGCGICHLVYGPARLPQHWRSFNKPGQIANSARDEFSC